MKVYILVDQPDLGEKEAAFITEITQWCEQNTPHTTVVNDLAQGGSIGLTLQIKSPKNLIPHLNTLYGMAKRYSCDFVIGYVENEGQDDEAREDVCFFGHEEGRADAFEVGCYLGFE